MCEITADKPHPRSYRPDLPLTTMAPEHERAHHSRSYDAANHERNRRAAMAREAADIAARAANAEAETKPAA